MLCNIIDNTVDLYIELNFQCMHTNKINEGDGASVDISVN